MTTKSKESAQTLTEQAYRNAARTWYEDLDITVAPDAKVECVPGGAWVDVRVFITSDDAAEYANERRRP